MVIERFLFTSRITRILAAVILMVALTGLIAAPAEKLVIVIDVFENPANYRSATIGNALTDLFISSLARTGKFKIMDTRRGGPVKAGITLSAKVTHFSYDEEEVEHISEEEVESYSGEEVEHISEEEVERSRGDSKLIRSKKVERSRVEGSKKVERSRVGRSRVERSRVERPRQYKQTMNVRLDMTVVDESQEIIFAEAFQHSETIKSATARTATYEQLVSSSGSVTEIPGSMMGRVTEVAVNRAVERLTTYFDILGADVIMGAVEGQIISVVDGQTAIIDQGRSAGLQRDDTLEVLRDNSITNASGEVVFTRQTSIGTARVGDVQDDGAMVVVTSTVDIVEGDVVWRAAPTLSSAEHIDKGTAFLHADFYAAALKEYRAARDAAPESLEPLYYSGLAYLKTNESAAALESFAQFLDAGKPIEWDATHSHRFGSCNGKLTLTNTSIAYRSPNETKLDHRFEVSLMALEKARLNDSRRLFLRATSAKGKAKNWTFRVNLLNENAQITDIVFRYIAMRRQ